MAYRVNAHIEHQNHMRAHASETFYISQLDHRGRLLRLDNVFVDVEQLILRTFACDTQWCVRAKKEDGKTVFKGSCCTDLEVNITPDEIDRLRRLGRLADERLDLKPSDPLDLVVERLREGRFFHTTDSGELAFKSLGSERCPLSWLTRDGTLRCAVNTLCERLDEPLTDFKAEPCIMFPLHYVEHQPGRYFLTTICRETHEWIGADHFVTKLKCLSRPKPGAPPAFQFLRGEIEMCFGKTFYGRLAKAAAPILQEHGIEA